MKKILLSLFILCTYLFSAVAENEIKSTMQAKMNEAINIVKQHKDRQGANEIYALFDPIFDYALMAKLALGFANFNSLSSLQQQIFVKEFELKLKDSFASKLNLYTDEKIQILDPIDVKNKKVLKTKIISKDQTYDIDYKFYNSKQKGWLIYDVSILHVSIIQSYKNQLSHILNNKSFDELIKILKSTK